MAKKEQQNETQEQQKLERLVKRSWIVLIVMLVASLLLEFTVHIHFYIEKYNYIFFYAVYGFASCLAIIVVSKYLGKFLKRPTNFYDEEDNA